MEKFNLFGKFPLFITGGDHVSNIVSIDRSERLLNAQDFATKLNISSEKTRRLTSQFKAQGRKFRRENARILYSHEDLELFRKMIRLHEEGFGTVVECIAAVCEQHDCREHVHELVSGQSEAIEQNHEQSKQHINHFEQMMKQTEQRLERLEIEQERLKLDNESLRLSIKQSVSERDKTLMQLVRDMRETKVQIAAAQKKKRWWQFWR